MTAEPIVICVPGKPESQRRAKARAFTTKAGRTMAQVYDPAVSRNWKAAARIAAAEKMRGRPVLLGPVRVSVLAQFAVPRGWATWKQKMALAGRIKHTTKPDADNLLKPAKDALKSIVWQDDSQVVDERALKEYSLRPALWIKVTPLDGAPANVSSKKAMEAWV